MRVSPDHTFGVTVQCDDYGKCNIQYRISYNTIVPQMLVNSYTRLAHQHNYLQCNSFDKGILSSIRCYVKRQCYSDFDYLLNGLRKLAVSIVNQSY